MQFFLKDTKIWLFFKTLSYFDALQTNLVTHTGEEKEMHSPAFCLKTGVEADQEGMIGGLLEYMLFCLDPINVLEEKHTNNTHTHK